MNGIEGALGQQQGIGVGQANIFGGQDKQAPGNEFDIFASFSYNFV